MNLVQSERKESISDYVLKLQRQIWLQFKDPDGKDFGNFGVFSIKTLKTSSLKQLERALVYLFSSSILKGYYRLEVQISFQQIYGETLNVLSPVGSELGKSAHQPLLVIIKKTEKVGLYTYPR